MDILSNIYVSGGTIMLLTNAVLVVLKSLGLSKRLLPLIALVLPSFAGLVYAKINGFPTSELLNVVLNGFIVGASSMGAYDFVKKSFTKK